RDHRATFIKAIQYRCAIGSNTKFSAFSRRCHQKKASPYKHSNSKTNNYIQRQTMRFVLLNSREFLCRLLLLPCLKLLGKATMASSTSPLSAQQDLHQLALRADRMVLGVLVLGAFAAVVLGWLNGPVVSGAAIALGLCAIGLIVWRLAPGSLLSRLTLSGTGMLMVALHIQLSMGLTELHFGVFVFLAFLLVYRDWRPILLAAATIAV